MSFCSQTPREPTLSQIRGDACCASQQDWLAHVGYGSKRKMDRRALFRRSHFPVVISEADAGMVLTSRKAMRRRDFIKVIAGPAIGWPLTARAQRPVIPVIGFLAGASPDTYSGITAAFLQGLKESGYVEGHNVAIEYRWADNQVDRLPELAAELVRRQVAVIAAVGGGGSSLAANTASITD
jgi:hypothetical protein